MENEKVWIASKHKKTNWCHDASYCTINVEMVTSIAYLREQQQ